MERIDISCKISWSGSESSLRDRIFLFCIEGMCMTGRVTKVIRLEESSSFKIDVAFIEPEYFETEKKVGNRITIQEASRILAEGVITHVA